MIPKMLPRTRNFNPDILSEIILKDLAGLHLGTTMNPTPAHDRAPLSLPRKNNGIFLFYLHAAGSHPHLLQTYNFHVVTLHVLNVCELFHKTSGL